MIPASHRRCRTAKESRGVERASGNKNTLNPAAASTRAQSSPNSGELWRESRNHTRTGLIPSLVGRHIVGQAAGALGDRPFVEHIRPDRVHHASPSAGAEFEDREERVVEDFPPALVDVLKQSRPVMGKRGLG